MANGHYVYIVMCSDNTLYTGYTVDVDKRMIAHNNGTGAKYTRARLPVELKYVEMFDSKSDAMKREYEIKQLSRSEKFKLMEVME
ncbi:GIY-YIG domain-containing protein [Phocicoccus schoeneichii]|uniref:GIY-YIG nuclease superfamily protein n=1 Tax=Phocicoccus schoeneichii TaxID=1812261 RepID=A0A6V7R028_9BACL|nr:GIY-YIG nuclease family protein [Jeotgalicoccus schoeneichii]GGH54685.1 GIY-YIG domain-containing protein [Jeotgalicoccus schoeneichii]CAD2070515.1 GIY-YIG nuclease superfamily protein [Jeotgalicoccus schoeneichii]